MSRESTPTPKQSRRAPQEVRELILEAAHQLFTEQGFPGTKTRQIADQAGVGESVVFRNFGSKAQLFEEAVLRPFTEFLNRWATAWDRMPPADLDPEDITRSFVTGFYAFASEHRELLRTLFAARALGGDTALARAADRVSEHFADGLRVMRRVLLEQGGARDFRRLDPPVSVAVAVGSVLALLVLDDWLFPSWEERPSDERQITELVQMLHHGTSHR